LNHPISIQILTRFINTLVHPLIPPIGKVTHHPVIIVTCNPTRSILSILDNGVQSERFGGVVLIVVNDVFEDGGVPTGVHAVVGGVWKGGDVHGRAGELVVDRGG